MDNNYNFKINPSPLKKSDISKHKDFDALLKRMEPIPPPKNQMKVASKRIYIWLGSIAATLLIGILVFFNFFQNGLDTENATLAYLSNQPYVNPPIESVAQKGERVTVNANEGGVYQFPSGSRMVVPRSAFANSYGALIDGEVEVHFKEYHDYVDFFLSGIPMEIDVDGKAGVLESAGMIEVYATQDGERLSMLPEKPIDIELKSRISFSGKTPPAFNIYYLDETKREWKLEGKDELEVIPVEEVDYSVKSIRVIGDPDDPSFKGEVTYDTTYNTSWFYHPDTYSMFRSPTGQFSGFNKDGDTLWSYTNEQMKAFETIKDEKDAFDKKLKRQLALVETEIERLIKPIEPEKHDGSSMTFELDYINQYTNDKPYEGTIFQLNKQELVVDAFDSNTEDRLTKIAQTVWEKQNLRRLSKTDFELTLSNKNQVEVLRVKPVLIGRDYDNALQSFENELVIYNQKVAQREIDIAAKKEVIRQRMAIEKEYADKSFAEKIAALKAKGHASYATNEIVKRTILNKFQINRFGTWNCDRPRPPYLATLDGTFQDQHFHKYQDKMVYHTDKSQNTVRRFYLKDIAKNIQFNEDSENLLWLVTEENKLAVFTPDYFNRIQQKNGKYAFEMDLNEKVIDSEADVRAILKL